MYLVSYCTYEPNVFFMLKSGKLGIWMGAGWPWRPWRPIGRNPWAGFPGESPGNGFGKDSLWAGSLVGQGIGGPTAPELGSILPFLGTPSRAKLGSFRPVSSHLLCPPTLSPTLPTCSTPANQLFQNTAEAPYT